MIFAKPFSYFVTIAGRDLGSGLGSVTRKVPYTSILEYSVGMAAA